MGTNRDRNADQNQTAQLSAGVGLWHFLVALVGIVPIVFLAGFTFRGLFTTAGDFLALISYIVAAVGAVFGVPIAVRGAQAAAENRVNRQIAQNGRQDIAALANNLAKFSNIIRTIGASPAGSHTYFIEPNEPVRLHERVEISPDELENVQIRLANIRRALDQIADWSKDDIWTRG